MTETTVSKRLVRAPDETLAAIHEALQRAGDMPTDDYIRAAFSVPQVERIYVHEVLRDGRQAGPIQIIERQYIDGEPDLHEFLLARHGAKSLMLGVYAKDATGRGLIRHRKLVTFGYSGQPGAGVPAGEQRDIDSEMADALRRKSTVAAMRELDAMEKGGSDDMKAAEVLDVVKAVHAITPPPAPRDDRAFELVMEMLKDAREERRAALAAATAQTNQAPAWITTLGPIIGAVSEKLSPAIIGRVVDRVIPGPPVSNPPVVVESSWIETAMKAAGPAITAFINAYPQVVPMILSRLAPPIQAQATNGTTVTQAPAATEEPRTSLPSRDQDDAGKPGNVIQMPPRPDVRVYLADAIQERRFEDVWAVVYGSEQFAAWVDSMASNPNAHPQAHWRALLSHFTPDPGRLNSVDPACAEDFIGYARGVLAAAANDGDGESETER